VQDVEFKVKGFGYMIQGMGLRIWVQGSEFGFSV
jgi:hypothetical protein